MKNMKRFVCVAMAMTLIAGLGSVPAINGLTEASASDAQIAQPENPVYDSETDSTDWDFVYFGSYPQTEVTGDELTPEITGATYDRNGLATVNGVTYKKLYSSSASFRGYDGQADLEQQGYIADRLTCSFYNWIDKDVAYFKVEPIRWRVLQNDGESLLLMADETLDAQPYQTSGDGVTWEECTLRTWLNGTGRGQFYGIAFDEAEQAAIQTSTVVNADNPFHGTEGGYDTEDKVFLMSIDEMTNEAYGYPSDNKAYSKTRRMGTTDFSRAMGAWLGTYNDQYYGNSWWLLRSPGAYPQAMAIVYPFGHVYLDGYYGRRPYYGIVPGIRVDINSDEWTLASEEETAARNEELKTASAEPRPAETVINYGDINNDGKITISDARKALRIALKVEDSESQLTKWAIDVDGDDNVSTMDAQIILERALKLRTRFDRVELDTTPVVQTEHEASGNIWIAADSIADQHADNGSSQPLVGWGVLIGDYFNDQVTVNNTALSSRSTKSFTVESNYRQIMSGMQEGDYLFISFGHNDERCGLELYDDPFGKTSEVGSFKWYLKNYYIDPAIRAGAQPVLVTPVVRRYFYQGQLYKPQLHTPYAQAMKELQAEYAEQGINVYLIDLHTPFTELYEKLGYDGTRALHGLYPDGAGGELSDNTHLSKAGATQACEWIVQGIKDNNMSLAKFLK